MGSTSLKGWVEILITTLVAVSFTFLPLVISDFQISLAVLPLIYFSLRRGLLQGLVASILTGIILLALNSGQTDILSGLVSKAGPYAFIGITGLFAKNTQRTLNNKRFSNAALNIVTATIIATVLFVLWNILSTDNITNDLISGVLTFTISSIVLLIVAKVAPKYFIPKNTPFLSRKEKSKLLND